MLFIPCFYFTFLITKIFIFAGIVFIHSYFLIWFNTSYPKRVNENTFSCLRVYPLRSRACAVSLRIFGYVFTPLMMFVPLICFLRSLIARSWTPLRSYIILFISKCYVDLIQYCLAIRCESHITFSVKVYKTSHV